MIPSRFTIRATLEQYTLLSLLTLAFAKGCLMRISFFHPHTFLICFFSLTIFARSSSILAATITVLLSLFLGPALWQFILEWRRGEAVQLTACRLIGSSAIGPNRLPRVPGERREVLPFEILFWA